MVKPIDYTARFLCIIQKFSVIVVSSREYRTFTVGHAFLFLFSYGILNPNVYGGAYGKN